MTPFSDETVIQEHINAGITLADVTFWWKVRTGSYRSQGFSWQEQSPYLRAVDICGRDRQPGYCDKAIIFWRWQNLATSFPLSRSFFLIYSLHNAPAIPGRRVCFYGQNIMQTEAEV
jgi:hypothetical protein